MAAAAFLISAWALLRVAVVLSPGESAWERMPASTRWAVEVHGTQALLAAVEKDGALDRLTARLAAQAEGGDPAWSFPAWPAFADGRLLRYGGWYRMTPSRLRALVTPETALIGMAGGEGGSGLFAFIGLPRWLRWFVPAGGDIRTIGDGGGETLHYFLDDAWCVLSRSRELLETIRTEEDPAPRHRLGRGAGESGPFIAAAVFAGAAKAGVPAAPAALPPGNPFLSGLPFPGGNVPAADTDAEGGLWRALLHPRGGEWEIRLARVDGDAAPGASGFAQGGAGLPPDLPEGRLDVAGGAVFAAAMPFAENGDQGGWLDELVADPPRPERDHPLAALGWLWARWGWLRHAAGDFAVWAGEAPRGETGESAFDPPRLPMLSLGWTVAGGRRRALDDFTASLRLFFEALRTPGGPPWLDAIGRTVSLREHARPAEAGGTLELPGRLAYFARPSWFVTAPEDGAAGYGVLSTHPGGLGRGGDDDAFAWGGFGGNDQSDMRRSFALAGYWSVGDRLRKDAFGVAREFLPLIASLAGISPSCAALLLSGADDLAGVYPRGKLAAGFRPADKSFAAEIIVSRRR